MNDLNIKISSGTIIKTVMILAMFYFLYVLRDLALIILTAVVIASAVEPATQWFKKYKISRLPAVLIVYVVCAVVISSLLYIFLPPLLSQTSNLLALLPQYIDSLNLNDTVLNTELFKLGGEAQSISSVISLNEILTNLRDLASSTSNNVFRTISTVFGGVFSFVLIIIFSFYLAVQENGIDNFLRLITPVQYEENVINLWRRAQAKIGRWMQGQLLLVVVIGVLVYLGLTLAGVPHALLLAVVAGLLELIPLFGPIIAAVPAVGVGLLEGGIPLALIVAGLYIVIQQFENHLIYPLVVKKVVGVPALVVIIALIAGGKLAGFLGIILSVPAAAVLQELTNDVQYNKRIKFERDRKKSAE